MPYCRVGEYVYYAILYYAVRVLGQDPFNGIGDDLKKGNTRVYDLASQKLSLCFPILPVAWNGYSRGQLARTGKAGLLTSTISKAAACRPVTATRGGPYMMAGPQG